MVRTPSFDKNGRKKGAWSPEEDNKLRAYIQRYGLWNWNKLPQYAGEITSFTWSKKIIWHYGEGKVTLDELEKVYLDAGRVEGCSG
ncbi:hypothetical protein ACSBR2_012202 [Camellia fascicularis]